LFKILHYVDLSSILRMWLQASLIYIFELLTLGVVKILSYDKWCH